MKALALLTVLAVASFARAEETYVSPVTGQPYDPNGKVSLEKLKARDERVMKSTGGFIMRKAAGPVALLVDAREKPRALTFKDFLRLYRLGTKLDVNFREEKRGERDPLDFARGYMADTNNLLTVVVIDRDAKLPALSVFPEERIGIVNAERLKGGEDPSAPEVRVEKEVWRAVGFIGGVGYSPVKNDIMQPYFSLKELDSNLQAYIQPMNLARMEGFCDRFGVVKARRTPYRVAVEHGWAPPPTNEYQKAVWEQVHAIPEKPIRIKRGKK